MSSNQKNTASDPSSLPKKHLSDKNEMEKSLSNTHIPKGVLSAILGNMKSLRQIHTTNGDENKEVIVVEDNDNDNDDDADHAQENASNLKEPDEDEMELSDLDTQFQEEKKKRIFKRIQKQPSSPLDLDPFDQAKNNTISHPEEIEVPATISVPMEEMIKLLVVDQKIGKNKANEERVKIVLRVSPGDKANAETINLSQILADFKSVTCSRIFTDDTTFFTCSPLEKLACIQTIEQYRRPLEEEERPLEEEERPLDEEEEERPLEEEEEKPRRNNHKRKQVEEQEPDPDTQYFRWIVKTYQDENKVRKIRVTIKHEEPLNFKMRTVIPIEIPIVWDRKWDENKETFFTASAKYSNDIKQHLKDYTLELDKRISSNTEMDQAQNEIKKISKVMSRKGMPTPEEYGVPGNIDINEFTLKKRFQYYLAHIYQLRTNPEYADFMAKVEAKADNNEDRRLNQKRFIEMRKTIILHAKIVDERTQCIRNVLNFHQTRNQAEGAKFGRLLMEIKNFVSCVTEEFSNITENLTLSGHYVTGKDIRNNQAYIVKVFFGEGAKQRKKQFFLCKAWKDAFKSAMYVLYHDECLRLFDPDFKNINSVDEILGETKAANTLVTKILEKLKRHFQFFKKMIEGNTVETKKFLKSVNFGWFLPPPKNSKGEEKEVDGNGKEEKGEQEEEEENGDNC